VNGENFPECPSWCAIDHDLRSRAELLDGAREHSDSGATIRGTNDRATVNVVRFDHIGFPGPVRVLVICEDDLGSTGVRQLVLAILDAGDRAGVTSW
jgi:hypothetical protein